MTKKTVISLIYIGFTLGFILGVILTTIIMTVAIADGSLHLYTERFLNAIGSPLPAFLIHSFVCGFLGMIMLLSALIFEIDSWGLLLATMVHFIVNVSCFYMTAFFLRWFSPSQARAVCTSLIMFVVVYSCIWLFQYMSCKSQVNEINKRLTIKRRLGI